MFTFKGHFLLRKKGTIHLEKKDTFWVLEILGEQAPPAPWFHRPWLLVSWLCPFRGDEKGSQGQYPGSAVAIRVQMW